MKQLSFILLCFLAVPGVINAKGTKKNKVKKKKLQRLNSGLGSTEKFLMNKNNKKIPLKPILPLPKQIFQNLISWYLAGMHCALNKGHFTFYAQVRNPLTKKWSKWHQMAVWGADKQKSFETDPDHMSSYHHVRLESKPLLLADGFSIKVEAHEGANLSQLKSFAVNLANLQLFKAEKEHIGLASVIIQGVPKYSQFEVDHPRNDGLCSPTSCAMLTAYLLSKQVDPLDFAEKSHDQGMDKYGSWPFNIAHAFERCEGKILYAVKRLDSFKDLHQQLAKGIPVVVSVRGQIHGAPRPYKNGHLLVVIGYDTITKEVVCHDPAVTTSLQVRKKYPIKSFLQAWERSHRLAYCADRIV